MIFFKIHICAKNLKDLKNMYKLQSENMFKSLFFKSMCKMFFFDFPKIHPKIFLLFT